MSARHEPFTFFRQSGWLVLATTSSGVLMFAVHFFASVMPVDEYAVFQTLLQLLNLMLIPALGLQSVFAQQTAAALDSTGREQLRGAVRTVLRGTFLLWLTMAVLALALQKPIIQLLKIENPAALWITILCGLTMLWFPLVQGLLQGHQNFLWLGAVNLINGGARLFLVFIFVALLGGQAAAGMAAALVGLWMAILLASRQSSELWSGQAAHFRWKPWLKRVTPLTLALGASIFMMSADQIVVQSLFDKRTETPFYSAAGMLARGLVLFTAPVAAVMFPKIVRSAAQSERSAILAQALGVTALLACGAALTLTLFPELPLRLLRKPEYLQSASILPHFTWAMVPLTLANVLINHLLARSHFEAVPWILLVVAGYGAALATFNHSFLQVIAVLGTFNTLLFLLTAAFTFLRRAETAP